MISKSGFLLLYKPKGISSAGVLKPLKRSLPRKIKIGHAGTLDPFAHGVLLVGIGSSATKQLSRFMILDKVYTATGKIGEKTDTLDCTGQLLDQSNVVVTKQQLHDVLGTFGSEYMQTPPLYSALKHEGIPLYTLARKQLIDVEKLSAIAMQKSKLVNLYSLELISFDFPYFTIRAHVSHGTYIRSLIADIGVRLGSYATTYELERSAIGSFNIVDAVLPTDIASIERLEQSLLQHIV